MRSLPSSIRSSKFGTTMTRRNDIGQLHQTTAAQPRGDGCVRPCVGPVEFGKH